LDNPSTLKQPLTAAAAPFPTLIWAERSLTFRSPSADLVFVAGTDGQDFDLKAVKPNAGALLFSWSGTPKAGPPQVPGLGIDECGAWHARAKIFLGDGSIHSEVPLSLGAVKAQETGSSLPIMLDPGSYGVELQATRAIVMTAVGPAPTDDSGSYNEKPPDLSKPSFRVRSIFRFYARGYYGVSLGAQSGVSFDENGKEVLDGPGVLECRFDEAPAKMPVIKDMLGAARYLYWQLSGNLYIAGPFKPAIGFPVPVIEEGVGLGEGQLAVQRDSRLMSLTLAGSAWNSVESAVPIAG